MYSEVISAAALVLVAIIESIAAHDRKKHKIDRERALRREQDRVTECRLTMKMLDANLELSLATALAVEQQKLNGEMKAAKLKAAKVQDEYNEFIQQLAARQVSKV